MIRGSHKVTQMQWGEQLFPFVLFVSFRSFISLHGFRKVPGNVLYWGLEQLKRVIRNYQSASFLESA